MSARQIVLDTETTGLEVTLGHRIVELAGVELLNRRLTGKRFHRYLNPGRDIDPGALEVHGISLEFLQDKPLFEDVVDGFIEFIDGAELIIHNAPFDVGFLESELAIARRQRLSSYCTRITDTLRMARDLHPGKRNSLDALCERYQIDNSGRTLHGALLDAELLAEVYLAMTRGQEALMMDLIPRLHADESDREPLGALDLLVVAASADELAAHQRALEGIDQASKGACLWRKLEMALP